ncbi:MAG: Xaa-Pro peptidase family protein [Hyphomicrobiales bacterium]
MKTAAFYALSQSVHEMAERGFPEQEFEARTSRAQALMAKQGLDALLLTTEADVRYFTGFLTRFWESPARPWFIVVPAAGKPIAVIPSIGAALMATTWIEDIRTWRAPDLNDDGVSLLSHTIKECVGTSGRVGIPAGHESHVRMPMHDFDRLKTMIAPIEVTRAAGIVRSLRIVKSPLEIEKIETAVQIAGRAFERVHEFATKGTSLENIFRQFQIRCLEEGADFVPYLAGGAGQAGYGDVISPAGPQQLQNGDILMLDTGLIWDGYYSDYDRNFSIGTPDPRANDAHTKLIEATQAAFDIAKPGTTAAEFFHAMDDVLQSGSDAGRLGHGLGTQLTEWPSIIPDDHTEMVEGMVMTLEPGIEVLDGRVMVHEENIVITNNGARWLSKLAAPDLPIIG